MRDLGNETFLLSGDMNISHLRSSSVACFSSPLTFASMEMNYKQVDVSSVQPVVQGVVQQEYQHTIQVVDVYPVGVEEANPTMEGEALRDDFI